MLDRIDQRILEELQLDGRMTLAELSKKVSLSQTPCWRRVQQLEQKGVITGYRAQLDRRRLGLNAHGFVSLRMRDHTPEVAREFERQVLGLAEVISCHNVAGDYDYQLEVVATDNDAFARLVRETIRALPGVKDISTRFSLREVKVGGLLPIR